VTTFQKRGMSARKSGVKVHKRMPAIGDVRQPRIQRRPQTLDDYGQWIRKIPVLAAAKTMTPHDHAASKACLEIVESCDLAAFLGAQHARRTRNPVLIEFALQRPPVESGDAVINQERCSRCSKACLRCTPHRYPESCPSVRMTRWHGMATASMLAPQA